MHRVALASSTAFVFALLTVASPASAASCSNDTFTIDGSAVTVQVCLALAAAPAPSVRRGSATKPGPGSLEETFTVKGQTPLVRSLPLDAAPTDEPSRTIDDVALTKLGLTRTLHLTLEVRTSGVRLEHALLVPGAVTLK